MATKSRLSDLGKRIQQEMSAKARSVKKYYMIAADMEATAHPDAMDSAVKNIQLQEAELDGMGKLAFRLGFRCNCETEVETGRHSYCTCLSSKANSRKKKRQTVLEAARSGSFTFDGLRCRDAQGAFVPVAQCRGKVGRDKAGRFVTLK